jgi:hypothetical protein
VLPARVAVTEQLTNDPGRVVVATVSAPEEIEHPVPRTLKVTVFPVPEPPDDVSVTGTPFLKANLVELDTVNSACGAKLMVIDFDTFVAAR